MPPLKRPGKGKRKRFYDHSDAPDDLIERTISTNNYSHGYDEVAGERWCGPGCECGNIDRSPRA